MQKQFIPPFRGWNIRKQFFKNKYKDLLAVFICLFVVITSTLLISKADSGAKVQFTSNATISLSGADTTLSALSGSEADSITVSGSTLTVDIPTGSYFTIGTDSNTVLKTAPSGDSASLAFDTIYLSSGYVSQWTVSGSGTGVSFLVGVPETNADYLVKANGEQVNYYKSTSAKEIYFSYTGDLTQKVFQVIRQNQPGGGSLPPSAFQTPVAPKQGFSVSINNGAEKTTKREVALTLNGGPDAKKMSVSESKDFTNASQEPYTTSRPWTLSVDNGLKTVYVKFLTEYGQPSEVISDSIVLETVITEPAKEEQITEEAVEEETVKIPIAPEKPIEKVEQPKTSVKTPTFPNSGITSSVELEVIPNEQTVSPEKNNESVNVEKNILASLWQAIVRLLRRIWPF